MTTYHWNISAREPEDENDSEESIIADSNEGKFTFFTKKLDRPTRFGTPKSQFTIKNGLENSPTSPRPQNEPLMEKKNAPKAKGPCLVPRPVKLTTRKTKTKNKSKKKSYTAVHPEEISRADILEEIDFNQTDDDKFHEDIILKV